MKKVLSLILAVVMVFSLAACEKDGTTSNVNKNFGFEIGDTGGLQVPFGNGEKIVIVGTDETNSNYGTWLFEKMSQITGLNIEPLLLASSSASQKKQVLLASGELPDIFGDGVGNKNETNKYGMQGAWAAVNDYMDKMPNFTRIFGEGTEYNYIFKTLAAGDGKLYMMPAYDISRNVNHGMLYRKDIFDKHGLKMWDSPETFYQTLKKLKELYPESYPLTSKTGTAILDNFGISWGGLNAYGVYYDEAEKVWKYSDTDPKMKDLLDFMNKLYTEGLLDPEFLTNTQAAWTTKMNTGKSFITYDWIGRLDQFSTQSTIEGYDLRFGNPIGPEQTSVTLDKLTFNTVVTKNKNSELSMKLVDFLYSDAAATLISCGIEGETFNWTKDGKAAYIDFNNETSVAIDKLREKYGMWMQGTYKRADRRSSYYSYTEREQEAQEWPEAHGGYEPMDPSISFSGDDADVVAGYQTNLSKKFQEFVFKYITGTVSGEAAWNDWTAQAKKLGADKYVKMYNDKHKELGL